MRTRTRSVRLGHRRRSTSARRGDFAGVPSDQEAPADYDKDKTVDGRNLQHDDPLDATSPQYDKDGTLIENEEGGNEAIGAGAGALGGAAVGMAVGGPVGAVVGGGIGAVAGAVAGEATEGDDEAGSGTGALGGGAAGAVVGGAIAGPPGAVVGAAVGSAAGAGAGDQTEEEVEETDPVETYRR